jgi:anti-anti-sigma factor
LTVARSLEVLFEESTISEPMVVTLSDTEWDLTDRDSLAELLAPALEHPNVVIDMTAVQYIDSSCLNVLIHMYRQRVSERGFSAARLVIASPNVCRLFEIVDLDKLWRIYRTLEEALES